MNVGVTNEKDGGDAAKDTVARLADRAEITDLLSRHGRWLDDKRFDDVRSVFTANAVVVVGSGEVQGADRVAELAARSHGPFARTHHLTTNPLVEVDGDRAVLGAQQIAVFCREGEAPEFTVGEEYRMEAVRTPEGWRLSRVEGDRLWRLDHAPGGEGQR
ncbi:nuclear transport factor 2 family protein [Nocardiopsis suaedae]|uniref:Nuclear transport factor 2 family protein n=1 Tax=Nocardiopsis suaedae TaxID=3018444 RepID=A0ABT4TGS1_9ACTN|nr:nuclear transport factor 2 family protein [Nocardiopsis suaedae]MDA2803846.1 nuclear transport factor 2 family protein [Nocardiopsis suaedae]